MLKNPNPAYDWTVGDTAFYHDAPSDTVKAGIVGHVKDHTATIAPCPTIEEWESGIRNLGEIDLPMDCMFESIKSIDSALAG